jgi:hypothetical protein
MMGEPLVLLVLGMTRLTALRIFRKTPLGEILLRAGGEHKLLTTIAADQNPRFKPAFHD